VAHLVVVAEKRHLGESNETASRAAIGKLAGVAIAAGGHETGAASKLRSLHAAKTTQVDVCLIVVAPRNHEPVGSLKALHPHVVQRNLRFDQYDGALKLRVAFVVVGYVRVILSAEVAS